MNREERRNLEKNGVSKETIDKLNKYDQPCTILEVVKLARAIAEDVANESLEDYRRRSTGTIIALTLQVEMLKRILVENNLITAEEFQSQYEEEAKLFEEKQREYLSAMTKVESEHLNDLETANTSGNVVSMNDTNVSDIDVNIE